MLGRRNVQIGGRPRMVVSKPYRYARKPMFAAGVVNIETCFKTL